MSEFKILGREVSRPRGWGGRLALGKHTGSLYAVYDSTYGDGLKGVAIVGRGHIPTGSTQLLCRDELLPEGTVVQITV